MKTILNILLLLVAIAWTYYDSHKVHAYAPSKYAKNTQKLVNYEVFDFFTRK